MNNNQQIFLFELNLTYNTSVHLCFETISYEIIVRNKTELIPPNQSSQRAGSHRMYILFLIENDKKKVSIH